MAESDQSDPCKPTPGHHRPVVDRQRCEAKGPCVQVCPYDVFEIQALRPEDRAGLTLLGKLKAFAHGNKQAYVVHPEACHSCGLCVTACPEKAIKLQAVPGKKA